MVKKKIVLRNNEDLGIWAAQVDSLATWQLHILLLRGRGQLESYLLVLPGYFLVPFYAESVIGGQDVDSQLTVVAIDWHLSIVWKDFVNPWSGMLEPQRQVKSRRFCQSLLARR